MSHAMPFYAQIYYTSIVHVHATKTQSSRDPDKQPKIRIAWEFVRYVWRQFVTVDFLLLLLYWMISSSASRVCVIHIEWCVSCNCIFCVCFRSRNVAYSFVRVNFDDYVRIHLNEFNSMRAVCIMLIDGKCNKGIIREKKQKLFYVWTL